MSRLTHSIPERQFKCIVTGSEPRRYVESIPGCGTADNYRKKPEMVDRQKVEDSWSQFYYRSGGQDA